MSSTELTTTAITWHSVPNSAITGVTAEGNNSVCSMAESEAHGQGEESEDSVEVHSEFDL